MRSRKEASVLGVYNCSGPRLLLVAWWGPRNRTWTWDSKSLAIWLWFVASAVEWGGRGISNLQAPSSWARDWMSDHPDYGWFGLGWYQAAVLLPWRHCSMSLNLELYPQADQVFAQPI